MEKLHLPEGFAKNFEDFNKLTNIVNKYRDQVYGKVPALEEHKGKLKKEIFYIHFKSFLLGAAIAVLGAIITWLLTG